MVTVGDSLTQGYLAAYNANYLNQAIKGATTVFNKPVRAYAAPTNGQTAAFMAANLSRYTSACSNPGVTKKIALVMAGTNDFGSSSIPTIEANLHTIWGAMKTAGFAVVCATIPNNGNTLFSNINTLNTNIQSNYSSNNCDALADIWANPNIGSASSPTNTTYFQSDQLHLTNLGYGIMGSIFRCGMNTVD